MASSGRGRQRVGYRGSIGADTRLFGAGARNRICIYVFCTYIPTYLRTYVRTYVHTHWEKDFDNILDALGPYVLKDSFRPSGVSPGWIAGKITGFRV